MSTADEIKKLNDLLKDRVITQEEFDSQKEKLLLRIGLISRRSKG